MYSIRTKVFPVILCLFIAFSCSPAAASSYKPAPSTSAPAAIAKVSPAVVGIIGQPNDSASVALNNRFSLAHGTGIIINSNGWIVTNAHVVDEMSNIAVVTASGQQYKAKTTFIDVESDIALIKISATHLPTAVLAVKPNIQVGQTVIAIGTPISFSLRNSVSMGVISGIDRSINSTYRLLQTDAAINPGNSGGPLINLQGEVIGINSLKYADAGIDNLGFSIPVDTVNYVIGQFFKYGKVMRPYSGLQLQESWAAVVGIPTNEPLTVTGVDVNSPAVKIGILPGDVIYAINSINVSTLVDYNEELRNFLPGNTAILTILSNGDLIQKKITFGKQP